MHTPYEVCTHRHRLGKSCLIGRIPVWKGRRWGAAVSKGAAAEPRDNSARRSGMERLHTYSTENTPTCNVQQTQRRGSAAHPPWTMVIPGLAVAEPSLSRRLAGWPRPVDPGFCLLCSEAVVVLPKVGAVKQQCGAHCVSCASCVCVAVLGSLD